MKNNIRAIAFFISATTFLTNASAQINGNEAYSFAEAIKFRDYTPFPEFLKFKLGSEIPLTDLEIFLQKHYRLSPETHLEFNSSSGDDLGFSHYRYRQLYKAIPVEGATYIAHTRDGKIHSLNGIIYSPLDAKQNLKLSSEEARTKAIEFVTKNLQKENPGVPVVFRWEVPSEEQLLKEATGNPSATYYPQGEFVWVPADGNFKTDKFLLAYKFDMYASQPLYRSYLFVDAETGKVLLELNRIHNADVQGTAVTKYSGNKTITADSYSGSYRLREAARGNGIRTFDMNTGTNYGSAVDFTDADNFWNNVNASQDEVATDAHWGAEMTYDYYLNTHNRNSIDGSGFMLLSYVHYGSSYSNAFWDGQRMTYGDGGGSYDPFTAIDIAGHEITHGLTELTANLQYSYESGALNESFSDVFGAAIEFYSVPSQADWLMGEDIGVVLRSMSNPNAYGDPDTYLGTNWATGSADNGGVHTNSGVQNFWYYLLSQGGTGTNDLGNSYTVTGIGKVDAAKVAFRNLTVYLWSTAEYADARFYAIQSAIDLFGPCTSQVIATTDAWYAVGVGSIFNPAVTAAFNSPTTTSCSVPFTANFNNTSTNAGSYSWNFGDGNTSVSVNPSHVYTAYGTFTVTLIADGGACGIDTTIQTAYISVDSTLPCIVKMPVAGTGDIQTSCTGTLYDNGGPTGNYADNNTSIITLAPTAAATVTLNIISFDIEPGSAAGLCDYDHVEFFDGPNTSSPSLGRFCNNITPPSIITSNGGTITIKHYADLYANNAGFRIDWSCAQASVPPIANFISDVTSTCTGEVNFSDLSTNGAASWLWNFGDGGGVSSQQNPGHTYASNGSYTVQLTATNGFGSDVEIKTSYITVNKPTPPTVTSVSRCGPGSVTLSASGTGTLGWYTDSVNGTLAATGSSFTTSLSSTAGFYVEDVIVPASQYLGPQNNTIGTGANYTGNQYLIFHCYSPVTLVSALVYANGAGSRTVQLRNKSGSVIIDTTLYIQDGATRITLNFDLPVNDSLQLGIAGTPNLYRNSSGTSYPYTLPGLVSIIQSSAALQGSYTYYYFFYDWEVREPVCISERVKVTAVINPVPNGSVSTTNSPTCYGQCNGSATLTASGGTPSYSYLWSNLTSAPAATGLCAGNYSATLTDANGCSSSANTTITQPNAIALALSAANATCGNSNGSASVTASDGAPPYSFLWNDAMSQTLLNATGLSAGSYSATVTDANGCFSTGSIVVNNDVPVAFIQSSTDVSCYGYADGEATAIASGGTLPYTYLWSNGATSASLSGIVAGNYSVTVTDISGCLSAASVTITAPPLVSVSILAVNASCGGICNGSAALTASGGTPPYSYLWNDGQTTSAAASLCAGNYFITITDQNGCTGNSTAAINSSGGFSATVASLTNSSCSSCDGQVSVNASGGAVPYSYLWNDLSQQTTDNATGLCSGNYAVTVTDASGCSATTSATLYISGGLFYSASSSDATCSGSNDGSATLMASGGTPPFSFQWSSGQTGAGNAQMTVDTLQAGFYTINIADNNSCVAVATVSIGEPQPLTLTVSPSDTICQGSSTLIVATVTGGNGVYIYSWDNGLPDTSSHTVSPADTTTYTVSVTDSNGCTTNSGSVTVFVDVCTGVEELQISPSDVAHTGFEFQINPNPNSGKFTLRITNPEKNGAGNEHRRINYEVKIYNVLGEIVFQSEISSQKSQIEMKQPAGIYNVRVISENGTVNKQVVNNPHLHLFPPF